MSFAQRSERLRIRRRAQSRRKDSGAPKIWLESLEDRTVPALATAVGPDLWFAGPSPNSTAQIGRSLYFLAHQESGTPGTSEIWRVDGGTTAQAVVVPALAGQVVSEIVNVNGSLFVAAYSLPTASGTLPPTMPANVNIWKLDAAAPGGAIKLTDFQSSGAANLQAAGSRLFFQRTAYTGMVGSSSVSEIWSTDGTGSGTQLVATFSGDAHADLISAVASKTDLYFQVYSSQTPAPPALWVSDGTTAGTHAVTIVGGAAAPTVAGFGLAAVGDAVYFSSTNITGTQTQVWRAEDGRATLLRTLAPAPGKTIAPVIGAMANSGDSLYFAVNSETGGEVWICDGTAVGTQPLFQPTSGSFANAIGDLAVMNNSVYFAANSGGGLFKLNDQAGASPVPLPPGISGIFPSLSVVDDHLFFIADDGVHGAELWSTDGSANGAFRRTDINPGSGSSYPIGPLQAGGSEYVIASDSIPAPPAMYAPTRLWKLNDVQSQPNGASTTTLSASVNNVPIGGSVTLTATVAAAGQSKPTGQVVFRDVLQVYGSAPLVNGVATLAVTMTVAGAHQLQAVYAGDSAYDSSISSAVNVQAVQGAINVTLTSSDVLADLNQAVTFTATVKSALPSPQKPTGFVSFFDGQTFLGTGLLNNGIATYQTSLLSHGSHSITARYGGDQSFAAGDSAALNQTVGATVTINLASAPSSQPLGQPIRFTAHLTASNGAPLLVGALVTFRDGTVSIGTSAVNAGGDAVLTVSNLSVGTHSITASFVNGTTVTSSPNHVTVQKAVPTMSLRSTAQTSRVGQSVTLTATLATPTTTMPSPSGQVVFKDGSATIGTAAVSNGRAVLMLSNLSLGTHAITATYQGNANYSGVTSSLTQTVTAASVSTTTRVDTASTSIAGQTVNLAAYVTPTVGTAIPTGSVTFRDANTVIGTTLLDPHGKALLLTNALAVGNHSITASFGGSGIFSGSTSAAATVAVRLASKSTLSSSASVIVFSQGVTLTAAVAPAVTGGLAPAGSVTFYDNGSAIGTANLVNGIARFTTGPLGVAIHKLTATYRGNTLFASSTSGGFYLNVRAASSSIALLPPAAASNNMMMLMANVSAIAPATGQPTGKVTFMDGSTTLGSVNLASGQAKLQIPRLSNGSHYLRAVYAGAGGFAGVSSAIVKTTVSGTTQTASTTTMLEASSAVVGQTTHLKATVSSLTPGVAKPTGHVTFKDGSTVLGRGSLQNGVATLAIKLSAGAHRLVAIFEGAINFIPSTSLLLSYVVRPATTPR